MVDENTKEDKVVYKFSAVWCGPCKQIAPTLSKVEEEFSDIKVVHVDIDDEPELAQKFSIKSIPCIVFTNKGSETNRLIGRVLIEPLRKAFRDFATI